MPVSQPIDATSTASGTARPPALVVALLASVVASTVLVGAGFLLAPGSQLTFALFTFGQLAGAVGLGIVAALALGVLKLAWSTHRDR